MVDLGIEITATMRKGPFALATFVKKEHHKESYDIFHRRI